MEYIIIVFRSRLQTVKFSEVLSRYGIYNEIINTPKEAHVGCGLSVKVIKTNYSAVRKLLNTAITPSAYMIFNVKIILGKQFVSRM